jgi:hypothetical protein
MSMAYQRGDRVILIATTDPHTALAPGSLGTVTGTDPRHGQIHVKWDDGSSLSMLPGDGDQIAPARPCCCPYPLPGPDRDALLRYLASAPGWEPSALRGDWTALEWQNQAASVRILVPVPGAPSRDDDGDLLRHAALKIALVTLGIPTRSEWRAAFRLAAVTALHHEHQPGTCRCGLPHPCPTYLAATTRARGELPGGEES